MLQFIRSLCEGNFNVYLNSLNQYTPWFFAFDHVHYACWLPVHRWGINALTSTHPLIRSKLQNGNIVVQQSTNLFSYIAMDQSHELLYKSIKGKGGAVGLSGDSFALRRWMIAGPELSRVVFEFEVTLCNVSTSSNKHHKQIPHVHITFAKDVKSLVVTFEELGNFCNKKPFVLDTKIIMHDKAIESVISTKQHHNFVTSTIVSNNNGAITDIYIIKN